MLNSIVSLPYHSLHCIKFVAAGAVTCDTALKRLPRVQKGRPRTVRTWFFVDNEAMDTVIKDKALAVMRQGRTRVEATDWLRVTLGLYYLAGLIKEEAIDFKVVDRAYNKVIYQALGPGHSITSALQFMSGAKVVPVLESNRFMAAFAELCTEVPLVSVPFLLELNLGVAKNISGIDIAGPVYDWVEKQKDKQKLEQGAAGI